MSEENRINQKEDVFDKIDKRKAEKTEEVSRMKPPSAKLKIRDSLNDKSNKEKMYISNANDVIFFKIVQSQEEFHDFITLKDFKYTFNPLFTYQILNNDDEIIRGYKNLKILISLTPVNLRPHIKFIYDDCRNIKDDLNKFFGDFYNEDFLTDDIKFGEFLNEELKFKNAPIGNKITEIDNGDNKKIEVYYSDIKNDLGKNFSLYLQLILPYFIEGANVIDIEDYFWHYFIMYEKNENENWKIIGFCTLNHFHMDVHKFRAMISQFFIVNTYQRRGFGLKLLEAIYIQYTSDEYCSEIVTEDPAQEFILLRDILFFQKLLKNKLFENHYKELQDLLNNNKTSSNAINLNLEEYLKIKLSKSQEIKIARNMKIETVEIHRLFLLLKYIIARNNNFLKDKFRTETIEYLKSLGGATFEIKKFFKNRKLYAPYIYFHDEPGFEYDLTEMASIFPAGQSNDDTLNHYYNLMADQFNQISLKCENILISNLDL